MLIIFLLFVPKRYFSDVNVGKLEEFSDATLSFRRVCLWRHNHFTRETGRVACHPSLWMTGLSFWANRVDNSVNMGEIGVKVALATDLLFRPHSCCGSVSAPLWIYEWRQHLWMTYRFHLIPVAFPFLLHCGYTSEGSTREWLTVSTSFLLRFRFCSAVDVGVEAALVMESWVEVTLLGVPTCWPVTW